MESEINAQGGRVENGEGEGETGWRRKDWGGGGRLERRRGCNGEMWGLELFFKHLKNQLSLGDVGPGLVWRKALGGRRRETQIFLRRLKNAGEGVMGRCETWTSLAQSSRGSQEGDAMSWTSEVRRFERIEPDRVKLKDIVVEKGNTQEGQ